MKFLQFIMDYDFNGFSKKVQFGQRSLGVFI